MIRSCILLFLSWNIFKSNKLNISNISDSHPNLCILQLLRRDPRPAVELEAGDEVVAGVEQQAHALHREVLALAALEVPQLAQAEERENIGVTFTCISHLLEARIFLRPPSVREVCMPRLRLVRLGQAQTNLTTSHSPTCNDIDMLFPPPGNLSHLTDNFELVQFNPEVSCNLSSLLPSSLAINSLEAVAAFIVNIEIWTFGNNLQINIETSHHLLSPNICKLFPPPLPPPGSTNPQLEKLRLLFWILGCLFIRFHLIIEWNWMFVKKAVLGILGVHCQKAYNAPGSPGRFGNPKHIRIPTHIGALANYRKYLRKYLR